MGYFQKTKKPDIQEDLIYEKEKNTAVEYAGLRLNAREALMEELNEEIGQTKTRIREAEVIARQRERLLKKQQAIAEMQQQYANIKEDSSLSVFYSDHVEGLLNDLSKQLSAKDIYDMDTDQLSQVYDTMKAMMYTVTTANNVFSMGKDKTLFGVVKKLAGEIDSSNVNHGAVATAFRRYNMYQMSPDTFFSFLCGFQKDNEGKAVQKMFSDGTERAQGVQRDFYQMFRDITETNDKNKAKHIQQMMKNPMKEMIDWGLKDADGNTVKTSRDMMLQAYMLLSQKDSFESIVFGGFKLPNAKRYYSGKIDSAYGDAKESALLSIGIQEDYKQIIDDIKDRQDQIDSGALDENAVMQLEAEIDALRNDAMELVQGATARTISLRDAIESLLTDYDRECIDTARKWYRYSGQLMTDVYLSMYGYKPKLVDDYVPIHRDLSTVKVDIREDQAGKAFNLENSGFTKERVKSRAPILLTGFFTELVSQQQRIARYYGFTQVQNDFNRIWNMKVPGSRSTIKGKVAAKYGKGESTFGVSGEQYVENYIKSVSGVKRDGGIFAKLYGNAASATLSLNPRVAVSQLASIPTAASVVGWKSMAKGFAKGVGISISSEKKNQLANDSVWFWQRYRGAGGITEISDLKSSGGLWAKASSSKVGKWFFNWCQSMDVFATASMWAMAEDYVQSNGMKTTDEGYKLAVENCYADIIRKSQPNYTVTERSDLLRDQRAGTKILTMYKTQSNQNFNILVNAIGEFRAASLANSRKSTEQTKADLKKAKQNLTNASTSVIIGGTLTFVLLRTLVNFAWAKVKSYKDDETDEVTADALLGGFAKEVFSSIAGMFALGGELYDILESFMCREKYYGISDSAISTIAAIPDSFVKLVQTAQNEDKDVGWKEINDVLSATLTACGVPYNNAVSFIDAAKQWYTDLTGGTPLQYTGSTTTKQYRSRILKYWREGDTEKVNDALTVLAASSEKDTDEEVLKYVTHGFANDYLKDLVMNGEVSPEESKKLLKEIGHDDPDGVTEKWVFKMENPDSELSDSGIRAWNAHNSIPLDVFESAWSYKSEHNKKDEVVSYILRLNVSGSMKRELWNALKGNLSDKNTPWE